MGYFTRAPTGNFGNGTSNNTFGYVDLHGNTYARKVNAAYNNITFDKETGSLAPYLGMAEQPAVHVESYNDVVGEARLPGSH